jgi:sodium transport system ATP-binding protein
MIKVENLKKTFGKVTAVDGASFTAANGAITTLLGSNGSGKSTTMRAITGLIEPDHGHAEVDGIPVAREPLKARSALGVFPDQFGLYPRLTTREHLQYFARLHGLHGRSLKAAIGEVTELLGLEDILNRRTEGFSQGQRMKVALGRTLIHQPQNLMLDEPTRGLDVMNIRLLRDTLKRVRDAGRCVLLSSHIMGDVHELSDLVVIIDKGRIAASGTPDELIATYGAADLEEAFVKAIGQRI